LSTTMRTYTHVELLDRRRAVEALPRVKAGEPKAEPLRLAVGAESLQAQTQAQTQTLSAPRAANAGKAGQDGEEARTGKSGLPVAITPLLAGVGNPWREGGDFGGGGNRTRVPLRENATNRPIQASSTGGGPATQAQTQTLSAPGLPLDPGLAAVVTAWPSLPAALREGILAMVEAARTEERP